MKSIRHIAFITPGFPGDEKEDTCIPPLQEFILHFSQQFPEISLSVLTLQYPFEQRDYVWNGIPVYALGGKNRGGFLRLLIWIKALIKLRTMHKKASLDVVHSFWLSETTLLGFIFSRIHKIKIISTAMGQDVLPQNKYLHYLPVRKLEIIFPSKFAFEKLSISKKLLPEKFRNSIIPWGVKEMPIENKIERNIDILGVGSLIPLKNYALFIDIVAELKRKYPTLKAVICGDGRERKNLQNQIDSLRLFDTITLMGGISRRGVLQKMTQSKILLHPSQYEAQGYVILEALAAGMSVLASPVGFLPQNKKCTSCITKENFIARAEMILDTKKDFNPLIPVSIQETTLKYYHIYRNIPIGHSVHK